MKMLKLLVPTLLLLCTAGCRRDDDAAVRALARRIIPEQEARFRFEHLADTGDSTDRFELESRGGRIIIRGNNSNSIAVGLNHYLKNYCLTTVSWSDCNPVEMPAVLPKIEGTVRGTARVKDRFFLNYCTFGYSMPWWGWKEWERFIDWMALQGVTMPLAITGQEAVWQHVWTRLGLTDEEVRAYFTGPAHLPWHRMSNIDRWQGPLPQEWIDGQAELQQRIVARERELDMTPVLPAFAGHVPQELQRLYPEAHITRVSYWGGFADEYRCSFLDPMDPLFDKIQRAFLEEQTRLFGTDHIYGADPFNEIDAPTWDPETLGGMSRHIYESMAAVDPEAVWLQMGWLFYADPTHWTQENIRAFLRSVPQNRLLMLDYFCEFTEIWKQTERFYGQPYLWCYLGNFGSNTMLAGNFRTVAERMEEAFSEGGDNLRGVGSTLEGFGVNQPMYEFVLDKAWETGLSDNEWIDRLADLILCVKRAHGSLGGKLALAVVGHNDLYEVAVLRIRDARDIAISARVIAHLADDVVIGARRAVLDVSEVEVHRLIGSGTIRLIVREGDTHVAVSLLIAIRRHGLALGRHRSAIGIRRAVCDHELEVEAIAVLPRARR